MIRALPFCLAYVYAALVLLSGRGGLCLLAVPAFTFVAIPIMDALGGLDCFNPSDEDESKLRGQIIFRLITWLWVPCQLLLLAYGLHWVLQSGRTFAEIAGMTAAVGITNGVIGITFSHELMHKSNRFEGFLAEVLLTSVSYPHFCIEHLLGHHKNVATPGDPASARFGESFYRFYLRAVRGSLQSAWQIEFNRLTKLGKKGFGFQNRMIRYGAIVLALYAAAYYFFGFLGLTYFVLQGAIAFTSLEIINYIEHYGLERRQDAPGRFERVLPKHSWNSGHRISNWFLINLARHSDHHFVASKRYQVLCNVEDAAPQMPFGYGTMYLIALVPPLWFSLMNPRVLDWRAKNAH